MTKNIEKENYIKQYPQVQKWINQCIICQTEGYNPAMPEHIFPGLLAENIRKFFSPFNVNELSVCEVCEIHLNQHKVE